MPKIEIWRSKPIMNEIILALVRNHGEMLTTELYRNMCNTYEDFSQLDFMDFLFRLEVRGFIFVNPIKKDVLKVEINPRAHLTRELMEDIKKYRV